jgi:hypothetical protein
MVGRDGNALVVPPKAGTHVENVENSVWQLPLDKHGLTPDNGTVSRFSRLS